MTDGIGSRVGTERGLDTATSPPADVSVLDPRDELEDVLRRRRRSFVDDGPSSLDARRNRIDRLLALVLDTNP